MNPNPLSSELTQRGLVAALETLLDDNRPLVYAHLVARTIETAFEDSAEFLPADKKAVFEAGEPFEHVWTDTDVESWPAPDSDTDSGYTMSYYHTGIGQDEHGRYLIGESGIGYVDKGDRWVEWDWDVDPETCYLPDSDWYNEAEAQAFLADVYLRGDAFFYGWARYYVDCARRFLAGEAGDDADPLAASYWLSNRTLENAEEALRNALDRVGYLFSRPSHVRV